MLIAGAGGHGLEVFALLLSKGFSADSIRFFDEDAAKKDLFPYGERVITDEAILKDFIKSDPRFCLGVGNPVFRKKLYEKLEDIGGEHFSVQAQSSIKQSSWADSADLMEFAFCGPEAILNKGVLINTRAHVHHECEIGDFTEISPGAIILGGVKIGKACRIGSGAVLLPGIELGDEVVIGAGAVVTKSFKQSGLVLKGVPAR